MSEVKKMIMIILPGKSEQEGEAGETLCEDCEAVQGNSKLQLHVCNHFRYVWFLSSFWFTYVMGKQA